MSEINLLIRKNVISPRLAKVASYISKTSIVFLVLFIIFAVSIFGFRYFESQKLKDLTQNIESTKRQIESEKSTESIFIAYADKGKQIDSIFKKRYYPNQIYNKVQEAIGLENPIVQFAVEGNIINLQVAASSVSQVEDITYGLLNKTNLGVSEVIMEGLDKSAGELLIDFTITFNQ
ncbi:hypothetical protein HYT02_03440 [Candidatus Gottesmanbacteria bacterium]|nr:hypothetical protein [Candidatus Gottesmanbacteria bacterium]